MKRAANIRVRPGGMERLREIAAQHGAISRSGINAGEASVSELLDRVVSGELVIVERERTMEQIIVKGILPSMAYNSLKQAPDAEQVFSTHTLSWRGLQNAINSARSLHRDYTNTHGNGAAHRIRISAVGFTGHADYWQGVCDSSSNRPLTRETVERHNRLDAEAEQEMALDDTDDAVILGPTGLETGPAWAALEAEGEANLQRAMEESRAHERGEN
jgi:hypothetical protein